MRFFDCFQLLCLIVFWSIFLGRTFYLRLVYGVKPITLGVGKTGLNALLKVAFLAGLILWTAEVLPISLKQPWRIFPPMSSVLLFDSLIAKLIGTALQVLGILLLVLALIAFGISWRVGIDHQSPGNLVTEGIFRISRNAIFLFMDVYFLGTFLLNGSLIFLIFFTLASVGLRYQILPEETYLETVYGNRCPDYRQKVGRCLTIPIGGVRRSS